MKQQEDREFRKVTLKLSTDDIHALALSMQEQDDKGLAPADDELAALEAELKLNQELMDAYADSARPQIADPDPSCLTEDQLWQRMMASEQKVTPLKSSLRPSYQGWLALALAAAGLLFLVNPWSEIEGPRRWFKGPQTGEDILRREGCQLALKSATGTLELDAEGLQLPASSPVYLVARCRREGFLQIVLKDESDTLSFVNVAVAQSDQWQELTDANRKTLGFQLPAQGPLILHFGLSDHALTTVEFEELISSSVLTQPNEIWRWRQQRQWSIDPRMSP